MAKTSKQGAAFLLASVVVLAMTHNLPVLDEIGMVLSFAGIVLNGKKKMLCWAVWMASNLFWITHFLTLTGTAFQWPVIAMNTGFFIANFWGWLQWRKDEAEAAAPGRIPDFTNYEPREYHDAEFRRDFDLDPEPADKDTLTMLRRWLGLE